MDSHTIEIDWENIGISNDFLFGKVMQDPDLCKELLQRILPRLDIHHVGYPEPQKTITPDADAKGIRLDIFVYDNNGTVYVIEMQMTDTKELPKRSRYYQSITDLQLLDKGIHYKRLVPTYIIFICLFDLYGKGRHIYTFENICREDTSIPMGDGTTKIFLNTDSSMDDVSGELRAFLDYVAGKGSSDPYVAKLDDAVRAAKRNRKWRREYMTLLMRDLENIEKGRKQGIEQGIERGIKQGIEQGIEQGEQNGKEMMILNALRSTGSVRQTASILCLDEQDVRRIARSKGISSTD